MTESDRLTYVPGHWQCPKCHFYNIRQCLSVERGQFGVDPSETSVVCPNDGEQMERVTWKKAQESTEEMRISQLRECNEKIKTLTEDRDAAEFMLKRVLLVFAPKEAIKDDMRDFVKESAETLIPDIVQWLKARKVLSE